MFSRELVISESIPGGNSLFGHLMHIRPPGCETNVNLTAKLLSSCKIFISSPASFSNANRAINETEADVNILLMCWYQLKKVL